MSDFISIASSVLFLHFVLFIAKAATFKPFKTQAKWNSKTQFCLTHFVRNFVGWKFFNEKFYLLDNFCFADGIS